MKKAFNRFDIKSIINFQCLKEISRILSQDQFGIIWYEFF